MSPTLTNGLSKLGSLTGRMRFGEMDWVDTHLDWKLWGEAGAVEIKLEPVRECRIIRNLLNSMKRCRIIGNQQERVCKEKRTQPRTLNSFIRYFTMERRRSR